MSHLEDPTYSPSTSAERENLDHDFRVLDVLIIGAGPAGLAAAARIREQKPSAMFTDEEHRRFHWVRKHGSRVALKQTKTGRVLSASPPVEERQQEYRMAVLDASGEGWLGRWRDLFSAYGISHLRSPMLWHVDPLDRDALLSHAHFNNREGELVEIRGCVGKEISKHHRKKRGQLSGGRRETSVDINQRDEWDYYTPSQSLFCDHCDCVAKRYHLDKGLVHREEVRDIQYGIVDDIPSRGKLFTVMTDKTIRYAKAVILAVGPANAPVLPSIPSLSFPSQHAGAADDDDDRPPAPMPQACHSMQIPSHQFPHPLVRRRLQAGREANLLVVGGGLTSAQLADLALRRAGPGQRLRVWQVMRGPLRTKAFDVDLRWMGKFKTLHQAYFHQAESDEERLAMIQEARGGGSITPAFMRRIRPHIRGRQLQMFENTVVTEACFEEAAAGDEGGLWRVKTEPVIENLPAMDYIYFATGIQSDFATLPYLQNMLKEYPIKGFGGYPCLNEDLMWKDDVPLFFAGRLAALRLGPAAPNIGGTRVGAERIALALDQVLPRSGRRPQGADSNKAVGGEREEASIGLFNYASGTGSKFSSLLEVSE